LVTRATTCGGSRSAERYERQFAGLIERANDEAYQTFAEGESLGQLLGAQG
jgi:hypothetical protein